MYRNIKFIALIAAVLPSMCMAELNGEGELGFTSTSGNTDSETINSKFQITLKENKWEHNVKLEFLTTSNNGVDSANSKVITEKSEFKFAEKTFVFGRVRYEEVKFSGFNYQSVVSIGVGHVFIDGANHKLEASAGAGYKDFENDLNVAIQESVFDGEFKYVYKISATSEFNQNLQLEAGESNVFSKSETFLKLVVVGNLGAKFGYEVKYNSDVPDGVKQKDIISTATLVYSF